MKFRHILFPVDFSDHSRALTAEVEWLASHFQSKVTLLHVVEIPTSWYGGGEASLISGEEIMAYTESEKQRLRDYSIAVPESRVQRITAEGSAAWHIAEWVQENHIDLVVMGTHGYGTWKRLFLGSVALRVLHEVNCPVWTHTGLTNKDQFPAAGISRIVCSVDLSDETIPLLRFAKELAEDCGATVHLIHSVPEVNSRPAKYFDYDLHRALKQWAQEELSRRQKEAGTDFPVTFTEGLIAQDTVELARTKGADLIITGRGLVQAFCGTLRTHLYDIIRQAPCPVLSVAAQCTSQEPASDRTQTVATETVSA